MNVEYRTRSARVLVIVLTLVAAVAGIMATSMALVGVARSWSEGGIMAAVLAILVVGFGGMFLVMRRFGEREAVYIAADSGIREEIRGRRGGVRVREIPWSGVVAYRSDEQAYSGLEYLEVRSDRGALTVFAGREASQEAAFAGFRDAVVVRLKEREVPATPPSAVGRALSRGLGWALLALVLGLPAYALSLPAEQRPEMWSLRWLALAALASPFIARSLAPRRARR